MNKSEKEKNLIPAIVNLPRVEKILPINDSTKKMISKEDTKHRPLLETIQETRNSGQTLRI